MTNLPMKAEQDVTLFATHPAELEQAQHALIEWARAREAASKADLDDYRQNLEIAKRSKWSIAPWQRRVRKAGQTLLSYKKIRMALEAGYYIIPPMPFSAFAIRTNRQNPDDMASDWRHDNRRQQPTQHLEPGEGRYVSDQPVQSSRTHKWTDHQTGEKHSNTIYFASAFDDVQFPVTIVKPAVLDATSRALALQVFDEIGLLERRGCGDPIVAARVLRPGKEPVTFFVGWWLDTKDL